MYRSKDIQIIDNEPHLCIKCNHVRRSYTKNKISCAQKKYFKGADLIYGLLTFKKCSSIRNSKFCNDFEEKSNGPLKGTKTSESIKEEFDFCINCENYDDLYAEKYGERICNAMSKDVDWVTGERNRLFDSNLCYKNRYQLKNNLRESSIDALFWDNLTSSPDLKRCKGFTPKVRDIVKCSEDFEKFKRKKHIKDAIIKMLHKVIKWLNKNQ